MENKKRLLIVEDDDLNGIVYKALLSKHFKVTICVNETEFYNALKKEHFDLFLMDISLVGSKDGLQLIREIRTMDEYKLIPVIVVTANAFRKDEDAAIAAGATKFISKPIENQKLIDALTSTL
jgi:CheY-like chemotaxis protein